MIFVSVGSNLYLKTVREMWEGGSREERKRNVKFGEGTFAAYIVFFTFEFPDIFLCFNSYIFNSFLHVVVSFIKFHVKHAYHILLSCFSTDYFIPLHCGLSQHILCFSTLSSNILQILLIFWLLTPRKTFTHKFYLIILLQNFILGVLCSI